MILVDTNVWSEATKAEPNSIVRAWARRNNEQLWLSVIVLAELRGGAAQMPEGRRRAALEAQFDAWETQYADRLLPFESATARHYAHVLESAKRLGRPIGTADAMIAATARCQGARIATRDLSDFAAAEVDLINPWET